MSGIGRLRFLGYGILTALGTGVFFGAGFAIMAAIYDPDWFDNYSGEPDVPMGPFLALLILSIIVYTVALTVVYAKRLIDMGWSPWWALYVPASTVLGALTVTVTSPLYHVGSGLVALVIICLLLFVPGKKVEVA